MPEWTVISKQQHAKARYQPRQAFTHAASQIITPVLLTELPRLVTQHILAFIPNEEHFQVIALLGVEQGCNLYVNHDGRWLGDYVPANVRGYPFTLAPDNKGQRVLCIDADQLTDAPDAGQALFDEKGKPTEAISKMLDFLNQCDADRLRTQAAVDALQKTGVIQPWALEVSRGEGETPLKIKGLYRIDEKTLNTLEAATYAKLQGAPMALAYAHLFSVHQLNQLTERAKYHARQQQKPEVADLEELFGDNDILSFDNI